MADPLSPAERALLRSFVDRLLAAAPAGSVLAVRVFGSRARGSSHERSDLDVAVELAPDVPQRSVRYLAADAADAADAAMWDHDAHDLALLPVVLAPGPEVGLRAAVARDGIEIWRAPR